MNSYFIISFNQILLEKYLTKTGHKSDVSVIILNHISVMLCRTMEVR